MNKLRVAFTLAFMVVGGTSVVAQTADSSAMENTPAKRMATLDAEREKQAVRIFLKSVQSQITSAAEATPATKYEFMPTEGEFKGVRTFARQVRHLSATQPHLGSCGAGRRTIG